MRGTVARTKKAPKYVTIEGPPVPCYKGSFDTAGDMPQEYWDAYAAYAVAIQVLGFESVSPPAGARRCPVLGSAMAFSQAECQGMQWIPSIAEQLGDTADDAQASAEYYLDYIYPNQPADAPSPDCAPGGALDIRPSGTSAWP